MRLLLLRSHKTLISPLKTLIRPSRCPPLPETPAMSIRLRSHAFAGSPLRAKAPSPASLQTLKSLLSPEILDSPPSASADFKVVAFKRGLPLASCSDSSPPAWHLAWVSPGRLKGFPAEAFVYLGSEAEEGGEAYWAVDVGEEELGRDDGFCFMELRTLMVATDWADARAMGELAIAGHARALLEWHNVSRFCGNCGSRTAPIDGGRRKQCANETCKKRIYPRVDPVVIMLVIDKENDRCLLSRQSRFVPRMWSCLAGFIEPGESLEEAVRRETWEEAGIEVGEVVYHSSQPWPVGPSSMPCQLMVGFFAYAKSLEIKVDKAELEDAKWHSKEDVRKALASAEYEKAQRTAAVKVSQMCKGVEKGQHFSTDFNVESGELAPMFVPGPFAVAHHLISSWVYQSPTIDPETSPPKLVKGGSSL